MVGKRYRCHNDGAGYLDEMTCFMLGSDYVHHRLWFFNPTFYSHVLRQSASKVYANTVSASLVSLGLVKIKSEFPLNRPTFIRKRFTEGRSIYEARADNLLECQVIGPLSYGKIRRGVRVQRSFVL